MRNIILYFTIIAAIMLYSACSNDTLLTETEIEPGRTISFAASMPENEPLTRVDLNQNGKNIELSWKKGDEIQIVFVQGQNKSKQKVLVTSTSPDKKTAYFDIKIPQELKTGTYDFYGVYGGNGLADDNFTNAILPRGPFEANSLNIGTSSVQSRKDVMLYFSYKKIPAASPLTSVEFKHLGSLFNVTLNDINPTIAGFLGTLSISQIRLEGVNNNDKNWAFNSIKCGQIFDLVDKNFSWLENANNYIYFNPKTPAFTEGIIDLWGWYPMIGKFWPELKLVMTKSDGTVLITSTNSLAAKSTAPVAGKTYHFYVVHDNAPPPATKFYFSNAALTPIP